MKYAFIINPKSGSGKKANKLAGTLSALRDKTGKDITIHVTKGPCDAKIIAEMLAKEAEKYNKETAIFACGGDGTVHEVANGLANYKNVHLGLVPTGSGNDFVRSFDDPESFKNIQRQLEAAPTKIDLIKYSYENGQVADTSDSPAELRTGEGFSNPSCDCSDPGKPLSSTGRACVTSAYCINGINIGFDGNTAILAHKLKDYPLINGTFSYINAVAINLVKMSGENLKITADGEQIYDGALTLTTAANGRFCGGGFESCPNALLNNGKIELLIIKKVNRRTFLKLVPKYKAGKFQTTAAFKDFAVATRAERITIEPAAGNMSFVADGEFVHCGKLTLEIVPNALSVLIPSDIMYDVRVRLRGGTDEDVSRAYKR